MNKHKDRLDAMLEDNGQTWDLSPNDKLAIQWAVDQLPREMEGIADRLRDCLKNTEEKLAAANAEIERLRTALNMFADRKNWHVTAGDYMCPSRTQWLGNGQGGQWVEPWDDARNALGLQSQPIPAPDDTDAFEIPIGGDLA
jgi:hypothetical protein